MPIRAKKSLGQNFLVDEDILRTISRATTIQGKHIVEVGPGYGALTDAIVDQKPERIDIIELDKELIPILENKIKNEWNNSNIHLYHKDVLQFTSSSEKYSLIANIPYYITSPILFRFLYELENSPEEMVIMMQEEVGEKILAGRKKKTHHSFLSLAMEYRCKDIEVVTHVPRAAFHPPPKVDSIVLRFQVKKVRNALEEKNLIELWKQAFTHPRKTLLSNLRSNHSDDILKSVLKKLGYDDKIRAEAMELENWKDIIKELKLGIYP